MSKRLIIAMMIAAGAATVAAQEKAPATKAAPAAKAWAAPKMPWGHPDISGTWTSDGAIGIPLARPDQFAGRV